EDRFSKPRSEGGREDRFSKPRSEGGREDRFSKPRSESQGKSFKGAGPGKGRSEAEKDVLFQDRSGTGFSELPDTRYQKRVPNSKIAHTTRKSGMKETRFKKDGTFKKEFEPSEIVPVKPSG